MHYGVLVDIIMHLLDLQHVYVVFNSYCWLIPLVTAAKCTENVRVFGLQFRGCIFVMLWVRYLFFFTEQWCNISRFYFLYFL